LLVARETLGKTASSQRGLLDSTRNTTQLFGTIYTRPSIPLEIIRKKRCTCQWLSCDPVQNSWRI